MNETSPQVLTTVAEVRSALADASGNGARPVVLVPTMGALHEGHLSLVKRAQEVPGAVVVVSIFVNPLQFAAGEDLDAYPRTLDTDVEKLAGVGADFVFAPTPTVMYPAGPRTVIHPGPVATILEGKTRPTHFAGVLTVVNKLFNLTKCTHAVFGEKDYQQLLVIRQMVEDGVPGFLGAKGGVSQRDMLDNYAEYLHTLVDLSGSRPLKVVVDAGNGMGGYTVPRVFDGLPFEVVPMYFELDGTFPNHEANPLDPKNLVDLQKFTPEVGADIGLAFDGDADRCFVVDERGEPVSPSAVTALVAARELQREIGATVIHNLITSRAVPELVTERGGTPVRSCVGHSYIKALMADTGAIFGGEHSAHYYFRDFWGADTGMLAALHVLAAAGRADAPLSTLVRDFTRYAASGEINSEVADAAAATALVAQRLTARDEPTTVDHADGLTVGGADWWVNLRASNTEPLLRLNVEAADPTLMAALRDEVLGLVRT